MQGRAWGRNQGRTDREARGRQGDRWGQQRGGGVAEGAPREVASQRGLKGHDEKPWESSAGRRRRVQMHTSPRPLRFLNLSRPRVPGEPGRRGQGTRPQR